MSIYLIPCPIVEESVASIPEDTRLVLYKINYFVVERIRTARRFLRKMNHPTPIDDMHFIEMGKHTEWLEVMEFLSLHAPSRDIGIISEAGCPGIADPGSKVVAWAHNHNISVNPLVGPSSILLALMASGMNGQRFRFHGYLPVKPPQLKTKLKELEADVRKHNESQIFIEAPYRNGSMIKACAQHLQADIMLCVAVDIQETTQEINSHPIKSWKNRDVDKYHKRPAVFILGK